MKVKRNQHFMISDLIKFLVVSKFRIETDNLDYHKLCVKMLKSGHKDQRLIFAHDFLDNFHRERQVFPILSNVDFVQQC